MALAMPVSARLVPQTRKIVVNPRAPRARTLSVVRSSYVDIGMQLAEAAAKPGSVDAPGWVLPVA